MMTYNRSAWETPNRKSAQGSVHDGRASLSRAGDATESSATFDMSVWCAGQNLMGLTDVTGSVDHLTIQATHLGQEQKLNHPIHGTGETGHGTMNHRNNEFSIILVFANSKKSHLRKGDEDTPEAGHRNGLRSQRGFVSGADIGDPCIK